MGPALEASCGVELVLGSDAVPALRAVVESASKVSSACLRAWVLLRHYVGLATQCQMDSLYSGCAMESWRCSVCEARRNALSAPSMATSERRACRSTHLVTL